MSDTERGPSKLFKLNPTYRWAPDSGDKFIMALNSPELMTYKYITKTNVSTRDGVNKATGDINIILHKA